MAEIRVTANTQHPNLLPLFDSAELMTIRYRDAVLALLFSALSACATKTTEPLTPSAAVAVFAGGSTATAGAALTTLPAVKVTTAKGKAVPGVAVSFAVSSGGGTVTGASQTTNADGLATVGGWTLGTTIGTNVLTATVANLPAVTFTVTGVGTLGGTATAQTTSTGVATFTDLSLSGTAGQKTLSFAAGSLTSATAQVTTTAGAAASIAVNAGNNQSGATGGSVATAPSAKVTDLDANGVQGITLTFAVASGGGSVTGASATTDASGIATVGSWTLGANAGTNMLTATASGLAGSPLTFTATASAIVITTITPALLTSGISATITGQGFSTTPATNVVTIDGVSATVNTASATQLTITVPTNLTCNPTHDATVMVTMGGGSAQKAHPVQAATLRTLAVGQSVIVNTAAEARCNELATTGGRYYLNVYNTNTTYSTTGAAFDVRGAPATVPLPRSSPVFLLPRRSCHARPRRARRLSPRRHRETRCICGSSRTRAACTASRAVRRFATGWRRRRVSGVRARRRPWRWVTR